MGLFGKRLKNPVSGTAQIVACTQHGGEGRYQNCKMQLVVQAEGIAPYSVEVHQIAPRKKWPQPGMTVPVTVSQSDPQKVKVDFDNMPTDAEMAQAVAEQQAAMLRGQSPQPNVQVVGSPEDLDPEKLARIEQALGVDLDGDGSIGGAPAGTPAAAAPPPAPAPAGDRVEQLERLANLHQAGALTDAEFAAEKARILGA